MQALVLAAGRGTRMRGLCDAVAKPMLPLANTPALAYILDGLAQAAIERVCVVVGHRSAEVRRYFGERPHPLGPVFIEQREPTGTGSAALLGREAMGDEPFLLAFGDIIVSKPNYAGLVRAWDDARRGGQGGWEAMLTVRRVPDPCHGAAVYLAGRRVTRIIEKPPPGASTTSYDNAGIFIFPPAVFGLLAKLKPSPRGEYELTDAITEMVARGVAIGAHELGGFWFNLTDPEALVAANEAALAEEPAPVPRPGPAAVHPPASVARTAQLAECTVGPGASLGDDCVLERQCRVAHTVVMPGARIGRGAQVEYAVVAPGARVAPGERVVGRRDHVELVLGS